jgi:aminopeptidase N
VTCKDWSQIWLNEGFATYYQIMYNGWKNGHDAELYDLYGNAREILAQTSDTNAMVRRNYSDPAEMFNYLAYPKGAWVLHMLRSQLGAGLYRQCIKTYLDRHRYGNVTTEDLRAVIEELSGRSYDQFFDQWVYHAHHPELAASYSWDETARLAEVSVRQPQALGDNVRLFDVPLTIRFKGDFGTNDQVVEIKDAAADFYFPLASRPAIVRLDPEYTLLAKVDFRVPDDMARRQLADQTDMVGRLLAVQALAESHDAETVASLKDTLNADPFYGVRVEAARALRAMHTDEALAALEDSGKQTDARVRRAVVTAVGGFFQDSAAAFLLKVLASEKNPDIQAEAIRGLAPYSQPEIHDLLVKFLNSDSYRQQLATAAIAAMRGQDDPEYITPLLEALKRRQAELPTRAFAQGLGTLAYLARHEEKKGSERDFLVAHVNDKREAVQRAALAALGTLGDPKALAVLTTFAEETQDGPQHDAAQQAIAALRADRKPADEFRALRGEVLDLQTANRSLRKDFDDFKKKTEARGGGGQGHPPKTKEPEGGGDVNHS